MLFEAMYSTHDNPGYLSFRTWHSCALNLFLFPFPSRVCCLRVQITKQKLWNVAKMQKQTGQGVRRVQLGWGERGWAGCWCCCCINIVRNNNRKSAAAGAQAQRLRTVRVVCVVGRGTEQGQGAGARRVPHFSARGPGSAFCSARFS